MTRTFRALLACAALTLLSAPAARADSVVYAAGDIACGPTRDSFNGGAGTATECRQMYTSDLILGRLLPADTVLALGDLQYEGAFTTSYERSYDPSWGRFKSQTRPVIGNHEGTRPTSSAAYCAYFGAAAHCNSDGRQGGAAFYSFDLESWHVVVLNSNCAAAGGCDVGSPQYRWLAADLAANPRACTLAAWHHPRWSTGHDGSNAFMQPIWRLLYDNGADLVLAGHSHDYERFAPLDGNGAVSAGGMRSFVVGTGGAFPTVLNRLDTAGSEVRQNDTFGVLQLRLLATGYDWRFLPEPGRHFTDAGSHPCRVHRDAPPPAPAPPPPRSGTPGRGDARRARARVATRARAIVPLRRLLRRGVLVRVTSTREGRVAVQGVVARKVGRRLRTGRTLLRGAGKALAGRPAKLRAMPSRKDARALRAAARRRTPPRALRVTLATTVRTASGDVIMSKRRLTVTY